MAALVLTVSLSSAACDLSCAFNKLPSNCDQITRLAEPMQMPMQMEGMNHAHHAHQSRLAQMELLRASSSMGSCQQQPCAKPATHSAEKIRPPSPQFDHNVLTIAHLHRVQTSVVVHHSESDSFALNLSALDPLSISLRI